MPEKPQSYDLAALLRRLEETEAAVACVLKEHGAAITELREAVALLTQALRRLRPGLEIETKRCAHIPPPATKVIQ